MEPRPAAPYGHLRSRKFGIVNWLGVQTLYLKEVQRFLKVFLQTVVAPAVTTLIFLAIFSLVLGGQNRTVGSVPFLEFLAPGLVMMAILQNSFANTASSVLVSKIQGNIVDILMPPLSAGELMFAVTMGGVTRGGAGCGDDLAGHAAVRADGGYPPLGSGLFRPRRSLDAVMHGLPDRHLCNQV